MARTIKVINDKKNNNQEDNNQNNNNNNSQHIINNNNNQDNINNDKKQILPQMKKYQIIKNKIVQKKRQQQKQKKQYKIYQNQNQIQKQVQKFKENQQQQVNLLSDNYRIEQKQEKYQTPINNNINQNIQHSNIIHNNNNNNNNNTYNNNNKNINNDNNNNNIIIFPYSLQQHLHNINNNNINYQHNNNSLVSLGNLLFNNQRQKQQSQNNNNNHQLQGRMNIINSFEKKVNNNIDNNNDNNIDKQDNKYKFNFNFPPRLIQLMNFSRNINNINNNNKSNNNININDNKQQQQRIQHNIINQSQNIVQEQRVQSIQRTANKNQLNLNTNNNNVNNSRNIKNNLISSFPAVSYHEQQSQLNQSNLGKSNNLAFQLGIQNFNNCFNRAANQINNEIVNDRMDNNFINNNYNSSFQNLNPHSSHHSFTPISHLIGSQQKRTTYQKKTNKIKLIAKTWNKDSYGLFDYHAKDQALFIENIKIQQFLHNTKNNKIYILRNNNNCRTILRDNIDKQSKQKQRFSVLGQLIIDKSNKQRTFILNSLISKDFDLQKDYVPQYMPFILADACNNPSSLFTSNQHLINGYLLKPGNIIKLGRAQYFVLQSFNGIKAQSVRDSMIMEKSDQIFQVADHKIQLSNNEQVNCKICLCNQQTAEDPLISPCKCKGYCGLIHTNCLKTWINNKVKKQTLGLTVSYNFTKFDCQICRAPFPKIIRTQVGEVQMMNIVKPNVPYIMLQSLDVSNLSKNDKLMHLISTDDKNTIKIGRANQCQIRLTDISVSRKHAEINLIGNQFYIRNTGAKFGTLIHFNRNQTIKVQKPLKLQIGRTLFQFTVQQQIIQAQDEELQNIDTE